MAWKGLIDRYGSRMNIEGITDPVSLSEGNTPLIPVPKIGDWLGGAEAYIKYEGLNPTGSFKDRGMTAAITHAKATGATSVICASTGNTSASAAAYAARAGMRCVVLLPAGKVAPGKLAGTLAYGAELVEIEGSFDDALRLVQQIAEETPIALVNSVNPARLEGQKTGAWEICEQLGDAPDWLALPVGNAGNISAYWMGFSQCPHSCPSFCASPAWQRPQILGAQAAGAAPLLLGHPVANPETRATAIRIGNPARGEQALAAIRESNGHLIAVTDEEIWATYTRLAQTEGIFCEPSSATGLAGLKKAIEAGAVSMEGKRVVAILTGHGLKDPTSAVEIGRPGVRVAATFEAIREVLEA